MAYNVVQVLWRYTTSYIICTPINSWDVGCFCGGCHRTQQLVRVKIWCPFLFLICDMRKRKTFCDWGCLTFYLCKFVETCQEKSIDLNIVWNFQIEEFILPIHIYNALTYYFFRPYFLAFILALNSYLHLYFLSLWFLS